MNAIFGLGVLLGVAVGAVWMYLERGPDLALRLAGLG